MVKREHFCTWWKCKLVQPLWIIVWRVLKRLEIELPYYPLRPLLSAYTKEIKSVSWGGIWTPLFIEALFAIAKIWKQPKYRQWMSGFLKCGIYTMENHSAIKKNTIYKNMDFCKPGGHYAKWNKPDREYKYCMFSLICGI